MLWINFRNYGNKMAVVNVKVTYIRPKYNNLKEWVEDFNNEYIGRAGVVFVDSERFPKLGSIWANPFRIKRSKDLDAVAKSRAHVLRKYERYIVELLDANPKMVQLLLELRGKTLGCWCAPEPCHGDILLKLIETYSDIYR